MEDLLTGKVARIVMEHILERLETSEKQAMPAVAGYFKEGSKFTCFDNTKFDCWVEEAKTEEMATKWCLGEIEADDLYFTYCKDEPVLQLTLTPYKAK